MAPPSVAVDTAHLRDVADHAQRIGERVNGLGHELRSRPTLGADAVGGSGAAAAYREFHETWATELRLIAGAIGQLTGALERAADDYDDSDDRGGRRCI